MRLDDLKKKKKIIFLALFNRFKSYKIFQEILTFINDLV